MPEEVRKTVLYLDGIRYSVVMAEIAAETPSHNAVIRVYNDAGNVIETHERKGDFKEP